MEIKFSLKSGNKLLQSNNLKEDYIQSLESKYFFKLPNQFRSFIKKSTATNKSAEEVIYQSKKQHFLLKDFFIKELLKIEDYEAMAKCSLNFISRGGIDFEKFSTIESIFQNFQSDDFIKEEELLMIGSWGGSDSTILVGYGQNNYDQIFIDNDWFKGKPIRKISNSIFEIIPYLKQYCFKSEINLDALYKNETEIVWQEK